MATAMGSLRDALATLKREQAKIARAITAIEEVLGSMEEQQQVDPYLFHVPETEPLAAANPAPTGRYADMTIGDAAVAFLRTSGKPQRMKDIIQGLVNGGMRSQSKNLYRMIYNILSNRLEKDVAKFDSRWGLREWADQGRGAA